MKTKIHTTPDRAFEFAWIASPKDICGTMRPFRQCWHVQKLSNGISEYANSRPEVFAFVADFYDIGSTPYPAWLKAELTPERLAQEAEGGA